MQTEKILAEGIYYNEPRPNAPKFVVANISIQSERFINWLRENTDAKGKVHISFLRSQSDSSRIYGSLDTYRANKDKQQDQQELLRAAQNVKDTFTGNESDPADDVPF